MKIPLCSLAIFAGASLGLIAQDIATSTQSFPRIDGNIPDGTPPPSEAPKPKFLVRSRDILNSETHTQGGRKITIQQITPITLPSPPVIPAPAKISGPAILKSLADTHRFRKPEVKPLLLGASIYRSQNSPPRSFVRYWPDGPGNPIVFWSSADFSLLGGMSSFIDAAGEPRHCFLAYGDAPLDRNGQPSLRFESGATSIFDFPTGKATFQILTGQPDAEALATIQSLHDLINQNQQALQRAYNGREQARLRQEAELKAHPPKPKDIVLSTWTLSPAAAAAATNAANEGGAK